MDDLIRSLRDQKALAQLVGMSSIFLKAIAALPAAAKSEASVLISGETGTGKELVARALHYLSARAGFPFVPVNCGSLPDTLLEDELFGHERGSFTDAHSQRRGLFAQADKGTLFLDEVDALSLRAQVALLRVLQDKKFRPLGASGEQEANVRILAATNTQLDHLVQTGGFRPDLYYRLSVFSIHLPPLRERREDILLLADHFLKKHTPSVRLPLRFAAQTSEALQSHSWPGNVRELENAVIRCIHLSRTECIEIADLGFHQPRDNRLAAFGCHAELRSFKEMKQQIITTFERDYLLRLMGRYQGNVSHAARAAGKERRDLGKLLKKHGIDPRLFSPANMPAD